VPLAFLLHARSVALVVTLLAASLAVGCSLLAASLSAAGRRLPSARLAAWLPEAAEAVRARSSHVLAGKGLSAAAAWALLLNLSLGLAADLFSVP
jgi:hypothetical protein